MFPTPTVTDSNRPSAASIEPLPESQRGRIWTDATKAESVRLCEKQDHRRRRLGWLHQIVVVTFVSIPGIMKFIGINREIAVWTQMSALLIWTASCVAILFIPWRRTGRDIEKQDDAEFELAQTRAVWKERSNERIVDPDDPEAMLVLVATKGKYEIKPNKIVDGGLLRVDLDRRLLLLEGDQHRYRIPGDAIIECTAMKGWFTPNVVLLKVQDPATNAILELPAIPRCAMDGLPVAHNASKSVTILHDRIRRIMPAQDATISRIHLPLAFPSNRR